ncbi:indole-3-glycerol phosphate synthase TrpC [Trichocoleus sp. FACHB-69]|uniref:indole-3-glycerol phosphate synthase TrpC n=2 Tax=Cyanophyceae TaxID=3028117 RepID=UPI0037DC4823
MDFVFNPKSKIIGGGETPTSAKSKIELCQTISMQIRRRPPNPSVSISNFGYRVVVPGNEPSHILEEIVWHKETEVDRMRERLPLNELQRQVQTAPAVRDFVGALRQGKTKPALIAEVKKASPSKGIIREDFDAVAIATAYQQGQASCLSVLTDKKFFSGSFENLTAVRAAVDLPVLCKDFVIYPYQIYLARRHGADAVLLIAAVLNDKDLQYFVKITNALRMTPLIEVHTLAELDRVLSLKDVTLVGINNRNLEDFSVDLQTTCQILAARSSELQQRGILVVSESGLHTPSDLSTVQAAGADAVLIGESLVKQPDPAAGIAKLFSN